MGGEFLNEDVEAVGLFEVHLNFAESVLAPTAAGIAGYEATRLVEEKTGHGDDTGAKTGAVFAGLVADVGTRHLMYIGVAKSKGMTPIMICAVTPTRIYLLDWKGTHDHGEGPTRILFDFDRSSDVTIKVHTHEFTHHTVDIHHKHGHHAKVECKLGMTHHNKKMNK